MKSYKLLLFVIKLSKYISRAYTYIRIKHNTEHLPDFGFYIFYQTYLLFASDLNRTGFAPGSMTYLPLEFSIQFIAVYICMFEFFTAKQREICLKGKTYAHIFSCFFILSEKLINNLQLILSKIVGKKM